MGRVLRVRATLAPAAAPRPLAFWPAHLAPYHLPSYRLGRTRPPCPPPTSCSSVAHGRAPRPSPLPATTRPGLREAATEDRPACALRPAESLTLRPPKFGVRLMETWFRAYR